MEAGASSAASCSRAQSGARQARACIKSPILGADEAAGEPHT